MCKNKNLIADCLEDVNEYIKKKKRFTLPPKRTYTDNSEVELKEMATANRNKRQKTNSQSLKSFAKSSNSNYLMKAAEKNIIVNTSKSVPENTIKSQRNDEFEDGNCFRSEKSSKNTNNLNPSSTNIKIKLKNANGDISKKNVLNNHIYSKSNDVDSDEYTSGPALKGKNSF